METDFRKQKEIRSVLGCKDGGGSRTAATSKMERFVIIVNGFQPLTIITKRSILDVAAVLDPSLKMVTTNRDIIGEQWIKNDDRVLVESEEEIS